MSVKRSQTAENLSRSSVEGRPSKQKSLESLNQIVVCTSLLFFIFIIIISSFSFFFSRQNPHAPTRRSKERRHRTPSTGDRAEEARARTPSAERSKLVKKSSNKTMGKLDRNIRSITTMSLSIAPSSPTRPRKGFASSSSSFISHVTFSKKKNENGGKMEIPSRQA